MRKRGLLLVSHTVLLLDALPADGERHTSTRVWGQNLCRWQLCRFPRSHHCPLRGLQLRLSVAKGLGLPRSNRIGFLERISTEFRRPDRALSETIPLGESESFRTTLGRPSEECIPVFKVNSPAASREWSFFGGRHCGRIKVSTASRALWGTIELCWSRFSITRNSLPTACLLLCLFACGVIFIVFCATYMPLECGPKLTPTRIIDVDVSSNR